MLGRPLITSKTNDFVDQEPKSLKEVGFIFLSVVEGIHDACSADLLYICKEEQFGLLMAHWFGARSHRSEKKKTSEFVAEKSVFAIFPQLRKLLPSLTKI